MISVLLSVIVFVIKNRTPSTFPAGKGLLIDKSWMVANPHPLTPHNDIRPADQTFLTYPEWFLVFSPAEQSDYFKEHTSTGFPYMKHVDQLWKGYDVMYGQVKGNYPFNTGYHVMIWVIAGSTTVEYSIKSLYETVIGRITDVGTGDEMTAEDKFNGTYERSYVDFIENLPWYQYDFNHQLKTLWTRVPISGPHFLRKAERRYYLTTELLVKSAYGWLIGLGTKSAYGTAALTTTTVFDAMPDSLNVLDGDKNIKKLAKDAIIADLPRYKQFIKAATKLAAKNVNFIEIAGNKGAIMISVLTDMPFPVDKHIKILFTQPIITKPGLNRVALAVKVGDLCKALQYFYANKITVEHIYDY